MPTIFLNTEIGQARSLELGKQALLQATDIYFRMKKHCSEIYRECHDAGLIYLIRDEHGFCYTLKECARNLPPQCFGKVMLMIHGLNRGAVIQSDELANLEGWCVNELEVHSPLMEYAVKKYGMLLTIAVTDEWMHDFFTFTHDASLKLPNLWGQEDVHPIEQWIDVWYKKYNSPHIELSRTCSDITLCNRSLPERDFTQQEWENIIDHFSRARERNYEVDNNLIKNLLPSESKYGPLYELRLYSDGIRVLFCLRENKPIVGGYYRYSTGEKKVRDNNSRTAMIRINVHV